MAVNRKISQAEYEALIRDAWAWQEEDYGVKVWRLPDDRIVKLFRTKRRFSSARLVPYNVRFARNADRLRQRGIRTPEILGCFHCPEIERHGVIYRLLPGRSFTELLDPVAEEGLVRRLAAFLARLHEKGVYFRSVHPGNVLLGDDGECGLIDLQDLRLSPWPLGQTARARNFRHLFKSDPNSRGVQSYGFEPFVEHYLEALPRNDRYRRRLKAKIMRNHRSWALAIPDLTQPRRSYPKS